MSGWLIALLLWLAGTLVVLALFHGAARRQRRERTRGLL
jgi:hypothetical protein